MKNYVKEYKGYKVPEGATHYTPENEDEYFCFYRLHGEEWEVNVMYKPAFKYSKWDSVSELPKNAIELPEAPQEWSGEGLPPVGTVCEFKRMGHHDGFEWCIFQGFMSDKSYIIEYHHHTSPSMTTCCPFDPKLTTFRPLKTQREKEREAFVELGMSKLGAFHSNRDFLAALFDNGARFTAPKDEENE